MTPQDTSTLVESVDSFDLSELLAYRLAVGHNWDTRDDIHAVAQLLLKQLRGRDELRTRTSGGREKGIRAREMPERGEGT